MHMLAVRCGSVSPKAEVYPTMASILAGYPRERWLFGLDSYLRLSSNEPLPKLLRLVAA